MNNISKTASTLNEMASNPTMSLKKELESNDWGFSIRGGNGLVKKKGKNLLIYDSYYYGGSDALKSHIKKWSLGGEYPKYFLENGGYYIKLVNSGQNLNSKVFKSGRSGSEGGDVWVEIEVTKV